MTREQTELKQNFNDINSGRDRFGRGEITDALAQIPQIDEERISPLVNDVLLVREAYNRMTSVSGIPEKTWVRIDPNEAFGRIRRYTNTEDIKERMLDAAISSMTTLSVGADLLDRLTAGRDTNKLCHITLQVLNQDGRRSLSKDSRTIQPVLLGDESTASDMLDYYAPFKAAIQLSLAAERVGRQSEIFRKKQQTSLGRAVSNAGKINPGKVFNESDALNQTLGEIAIMQRATSANLATGLETVTQVGIEPTDSTGLRDNLQSAKETGSSAKQIQKLLQGRNKLADSVRGQLRLGQNVHLSTLNSFNFGTLAEFSENISAVGETVARISLTDTIINAAITSTLALQAAGQYLLRGGNIDVDDLNRTANKLFTLANRYKIGEGDTKYLEPNIR
jgi:hypothetical protein